MCLTVCLALYLTHSCHCFSLSLSPSPSFSVSLFHCLTPSLFLFSHCICICLTLALSVSLSYHFSLSLPSLLPLLSVSPTCWWWGGRVLRFHWTTMAERHHCLSWGHHCPCGWGSLTEKGSMGRRDSFKPGCGRYTVNGKYMPMKAHIHTWLQVSAASLQTAPSKLEFPYTGVGVGESREWELW